MKAWLFTGPNEPLQLIEREVPSPGPGQVIVKVRAAGLCHSDVGFMDGTILPMLPKQPPIVLGHEVAGVVAELGPGVSDFKVGERVVALGVEAFAPGWTVDGGYATHCLLTASGLSRLPEAVSFAQGAAATDAGQTAYGAVMNAGQVRSGMRVGVIGLGGLGITGARIAVINGAEVYGAEPRREAWAAAKAQGVTEIFDDVSELAPLNLDVIIDFAGFGSTTAGAIGAVRPGGLVVQVGLGLPEATISTADLINRQVTLRGSRGGSLADTVAVISHMAKGDLTIQANAIGFDDIPEGLERLKRGGVVGRIVAELA